MEIYLLKLDGGRTAFYTEARDISDSADAKAEPRGWIERKRLAWRENLRGEESNGDSRFISGRVRRVWSWLQRHTFADEPLLRRLSRVESITLHHPAAMTAKDARRAWRDYLKRREARHFGRLILNSLIAPTTLLLAPLPGPNVIGYWFAYRAVCHWLALRGARRALKLERRKLSPRASEALNETVSASSESVKNIAVRHDLAELEQFVSRLLAQLERRSREAATPVAQ